MSCCSSQRQPVTYGFAGARPAPPPPIIPDGAETLRYTGTGPLALRGPSSGLVYQVDNRRRIIQADPSDVAALLRTNLFMAD